jgi:hypothetical protein
MSFSLPLDEVVATESVGPKSVLFTSQRSFEYEGRDNRCPARASSGTASQRCVFSPALRSLAARIGLVVEALVIDDVDQMIGVTTDIAASLAAALISAHDRRAANCAHHGSACI